MPTKGWKSYRDFFLKIEPVGEGSYRVSARAPGGGAARANFVLPFDEKDIEIFLLRIGQPKRLGTRGLILQPAQPALDFGNQLFNAVFKDEVRDIFVSARNDAERKDYGLRLRLRLEGAPELADLPWEYLYDSPDFLALSTTTPLVRYIDLPSPPRPLAVDLPLRILVTVSSPHGLPELEIDAEKSKIRGALAGLIEGQKIELIFTQDATLQTLQRTLRQARSQGQPFHAWHFIGHGIFDPTIQAGQLALCNAGGLLSPTDGFQLGTLFRDYPEIRLILLNACEGARNSRQDPFAGVATALVERGIPAVIGMQFEISDEAAIVFSEGFYTALVDGLPVDAALTEARRSIFFMPNWVEWATPVLFMRSADGVLFKIQRLPSRELRETLAAQKAEQERLKLERAEADRVAREWAESQRLAEEKLEQDRLEQEKVEAERLAIIKAEEERLAAEKAQRERLEKEKAEAERLARERAEAERLAAQIAEAERQAAEKAEQERLEMEKAEAERLAREQEEAELLAEQKAEEERLAQVKAKEERLAAQKADQDRLTREQAEAQRLGEEKAEQEQLAHEKAETERKAKEEDDRQERQQAEQDQLVTQSVEAEGVAIEKPVQEPLPLEQTGAAKPRTRKLSERLPRWAIWAGLFLVVAVITGYVATRQINSRDLDGSFTTLMTEEAALPIEASTPTETSPPRYIQSITQTPPQELISVSHPQCTVKKSLNLRNGPGTAYNPPIGALEKGAELIPIGYEPQGIPGGTWLQVQDTDGRTGWVSAETENVQCNLELTSIPVGKPPPTSTHPTTPASVGLIVNTLSAPDPTVEQTETALQLKEATGHIAFASDRDSNDHFEIYVMNADGSGQNRLTNNSKYDDTPAWSPDGTRIAFSSDREGNTEIYVMNADGSEQTRLTNNSTLDYSPTWSPDGTRIAFACLPGDNWEICMMNADGSEQTRLTYDSADDWQPAWSPDGTRIAFASDRDSNDHFEIYVMNADGSEQTRLTNNSTDDDEPAWSPDGTRIAFACLPGDNWEICMMNAGGSELTRLTNNSTDDGEPAWSPDGTRIAFTCAPDDNSWDICVMNANGSEQNRLTNNSEDDYQPAWQP